MLHCDFANRLWADVEPILIKFHPAPVTEEEKAFGIFLRKPTTGTLIRNWVTYLLRDCITQEEREAYHSKRPSVKNAKKKVNRFIVHELNKKIIRYKHENNLERLEKLITYAEVLCVKQTDGTYDIKNIYDDH